MGIFVDQFFCIFFVNFSGRGRCFEAPPVVIIPGMFGGGDPLCPCGPPDSVEVSVSVSGSVSVCKVVKM